MTSLLAIGGACWQQWKTLASGWNFVVGLVSNVPIAVAFAWVAIQSDRAGVVGYVAIGLFLMTLWNQSQVGVRWSLYAEAGAGTLEFSLISRSPLMMLLLGKALAHELAGARPALAALLVAIVMAPRLPEVQNPLALAGAIGAALVALSAVAFIFTPLSVLAARQLDPILAVRPFIVVFSGFLYPVSFLPGGLASAARVLPTSWAMDAVLLALQGGADDQIAANVVVAVALSALYFVLTSAMFVKVEERLRVTGALVS